MIEEKGLEKEVRQIDDFSWFSDWKTIEYLLGLKD